MKRQGKIRIQKGWLWAGLVTLLLLAVFGGWLIFGRPDSGGGSGPGASTTPVPRPALGRQLSLGDYRAAVSAALDAVRSARDAEPATDERRDRVEAAAGELERVEGAGVEAVPGERSSQAEIDNSAAIQELRSDEPNLEALESHLDTLAQSLEEGTTAYLEGTLEGEAADARLREVLSDRLFNYEEQLSPFQRLVRWLSELTGSNDPNGDLSRVLMAIMAGIAAGSLTFLASDRIRNRWLRLGLSVLVGTMVGVVFLQGLQNLDMLFYALAVAGLVLAAVAMGLFTMGLNRGSTAAAPRAVSDLAAVLGMNSAEAQRRASASAAEGDYRSALRYRCLAVLLVLDEAGKLVFDRSATNREYLYRASGPLHDELQPLLDRFDDVWYGNASTDAEEWTAYSARAERVERLAVGQAAGERAA